MRLSDSNWTSVTKVKPNNCLEFGRNVRNDIVLQLLILIEFRVQNLRLSNDPRYSPRIYFFFNLKKYETVHVEVIASTNVWILKATTEEYIKEWRSPYNPFNKQK